MKNIITIDVDTDREENPFLISKPKEFQPKTTDEAKESVIDDISVVCETLCRMIITATDSGYAVKSDLIGASITNLNLLLVDNQDEVK
jgi:hypothetical protein